MSQYLLSTYMDKDAVPSAPPSPEQMQVFMKRIVDLEGEMAAKGTFLFGGALHGPDASTVVNHNQGDVLLTDGPFAEAKEHIAGFYVINSEDLDEALEWATKTSEATGRPIEVRPFRATGRAQA